MAQTHGNKAAQALPPELQFAVAQGVVYAAAADGEAGREWAARVAAALGLSLDALPATLRKEDVERVAEFLGMQEGQPQKTDKDRRYSARDRARIFRTADALKMPALRVYEAEAIVAEQLKAAAEKAAPDTSSAVTAAAGKSAIFRKVAIGAGAVAGGVLLGVTGGLAAPAILAVAGIGLGAGGAATVGVLLGLSGGGLGAYRTKRRTAEITDFSFERLDEGAADPARSAPPALSATICCAGLLIEADDYCKPFQTAVEALSLQQEAWALKAERDFFLSQGQAIDTYLRDKLLQRGATEILKRTALSAFYAAVALPATVYSSFTMLLDNNWQRAADKANKVGTLLADVLESDVQGKRPISLVGSGLGALTVFRALLELEKRGKTDVVCDVHLISLPRAPSTSEWGAVRSVVSRRITNTYSTNDWVLALIARLHSFAYNVAGLSKVEAEGVDNIDVSDLLEGHLSLRSRLPAILDRVGLMQ